MNENLKIEAFVLAGGKSSRMGQDKGLMPLSGQPMVSYILKTLKEAGLQVNIIANDKRYEVFGVPVFPDIITKKGPMGGLLTAFEFSTADIVLLVSCDMPLIPKEAVLEITKKASEEKIVAMLTDKRINPLFALYPVQLKNNLKERIANEELKMSDFIQKNEHILISSQVEEKYDSFRNINTPEELNEIEKNGGI